MPKSAVPKYRRQREKSGGDRAFVVLGGRRVHLGPHGSEASKERYARAIAEWEAAGRRAPIAQGEDITIVELAAGFLRKRRSGDHPERGSVALRGRHSEWRHASDTPRFRCRRTRAPPPSPSRSMLTVTAATRIYIVAGPTDMRNSFNGLQAIVENELSRDARKGDIFVFSNRRRDRLKLIYWEPSGFWVCSKRLEKGSFAWPQIGESHVEMTREELALLLGGIDLRGTKRRAWYGRGVATSSRA